MIDPNILSAAINVIAALILALLAVYIRKYSKYIHFAMAVLSEAAFLANELAELIREIDIAAADGKIERDEADRIMRKLLMIVKEFQEMSGNE